MSADETPMFARSGLTSTLGKCTEELKTSVPLTIECDFKQLAARAGCTSAELLRDLICLATHKTTFDELCAKDRRAVLPNQGREFAELIARGEVS